MRARRALDVHATTCALVHDSRRTALRPNIFPHPVWTNIGRVDAALRIGGDAGRSRDTVFFLLVEVGVWDEVGDRTVFGAPDVDSPLSARVVS